MLNLKLLSHHWNGTVKTILLPYFNCSSSAGWFSPWTKNTFQVYFLMPKANKSFDPHAQTNLLFQDLCLYRIIFTIYFNLRLLLANFLPRVPSAWYPTMTTCVSGNSYSVLNGTTLFRQSPYHSPITTFRFLEIMYQSYPYNQNQ
jgi:hypothetical protein